MIINGYEYIPREQRKHILLLSDDLRMSSGVGTASRTFVMGTAHRFNWFQLGTAINHPEMGKRFDLSQDLNNRLGITDAQVMVQPHNNYGDPDLIRMLLHEFKFDAIMHFTDPRQWLWLYNMEHEIRLQMPIFFYHVWDNLPYPEYNKTYYQSCDWIACISKQTENIVKNVWNEFGPEDWQVTYIPHGIDEKEYYPTTELEPGLNREVEGHIKTDYDMMLDMKKKIFGENEFDFIVFYNNRNIRRKSPSDIILAFVELLKSLPKEKADKCALLMHTHVVDFNGTDLNEVRNMVGRGWGRNINFHETKVNPIELNYLYNMSDITINIAAAEGFGLSTAESLMAGVPILATVTGGLKDKMGFKDENGKYIKFTKDFGSNHDGKIKGTHGEWVFPIFPAARSLVGSPPTPYIFDDRVRWEDTGILLREIYDLGKDELRRRGLEGRKFVLKEEVGMSASNMCNRFITGMEKAWEKWKPRNRYSIIKF